MKSKLLASAIGVVLLGTSALALADNERWHDHGRGPAYHGQQGDWHDHGEQYHWSRDPRQAHYARPPNWYRPGWHHPGWHAPYPYYGHAPRYYGPYDDGVTIIFKGRIN